MTMYTSEQMEEVGEELGKMVLRCKKNNNFLKIVKVVGFFSISFVIYLIISMS